MSVEFTGIQEQHIDWQTILNSIAQKTFVCTITCDTVINGVVLAKINAGVGWKIELSSSGYISYSQYWSGTGGFVDWRTPTGSVTASTPLRIVLAYDWGATGNNVLGWINGASQTMTRTGVPSGLAQESGGDFAVGDNAVLGSPAMDGTIDDLRVYQGMATQAMVTNDYTYYQAGDVNADAFSSLTPKFRCLLRAAKDIAPASWVGAVLSTANVLKDTVNCETGTPNLSPLGA